MTIRWTQKQYDDRQARRQAEADRADLFKPAARPEPLPDKTVKDSIEGRQRAEAAYAEYDRLVKEIEG